jgi:hypothetical protein
VRRDDTSDSPALKHQPLSELLARIAADDTRERVSVADLLELAGDRAFGALMFVFALPNVVPTPPGVSAVLGLPLILLSAQFFWGRKTPWLPRAISTRSIARTDLAAVISRMTSPMRRFERVLKPRLGLLVSPAAERLLGFALLVLAVILFLPIPLGNMLPAAAICILSLALVEHDGLAVLIGVLIGAIAVMIVWGALFGLINAALALLSHLGWV